MLKLNEITVKVDNKEIIEKVNISFELWKTFFLLGKNGSGKSSLALAIVWHPKYNITSWEITLDWTIINSIPPEERSKLGIFLTFQNVPEIKWIKLNEYLRTIYNSAQTNENIEFKPLSSFLFKRYINQFLQELNIPEWFLDRDLNVWFSGWEKRKIELLQIKLLNPKYIILDEIDSWLDIDAFKIVADNLAKIKNGNNTLIFITHNFNLLDYIKVDWVFVLEKWKLIDSGWNELIDKIKKYWYCSYCSSDENNCEIKTKCEIKNYPSL